MKSPDRLHNASGLEENTELTSTRYQMTDRALLTFSPSLTSGVLHAADQDARIKEALSFIPADIPRDGWWKVGMALHAHYGADGFDMFDQWSAQGDSYDSRAARDTYRSFRSGGGIGIGTLFEIAKRYGFDTRHHPSALGRSPSRSPNDRSSRMAVIGGRDEDYESVARECERLWTWYEAATSATPYLQRKGLEPVADLKATPDGCLVVPVRDVDGKLWSLQYINGSGDKRFKKGGRLRGAFFMIGDPMANRLAVCEGVATGLSIHAAGMPAVAVAFSKGMLAPVAKLLADRYPAAAMVISADNDGGAGRNGGVEAATAAAHVAGARLAIPVIEGRPRCDFDDVRQVLGLAAVREQLAAAREPSETTSPARKPKAHSNYRLRTAEELAAHKPMEWLVRGIFPKTGIAAIYGPSRSGKSFLALDLAAAIASEMPEWFGRKIQSVPVTYVGLEGESGLSLRLRAWSKHHGEQAPSKLKFITQGLNLRSQDDINALGAEIVSSGHGGGVTIIDTLARASGGADENSSSHMGELIDGASQLHQMTAGLVILVHHTGKNQQAGLRGHSSLLGALDGAIELDRDSNQRRWSIAKVKDEADGLSFGFGLLTVELGRDEDDEPITSCIVQPVDEEEGACTEHFPRIPRGPRQQMVLALLNELLLVSGSEGRQLGMTEAIQQIASKLQVAPHKRSNVVKETLGQLIEQGFCRYDGNQLMII